MRVSAAWLWSGRVSPIANGAVLTNAEGRIVAVGADDAVPEPDGVQQVSYPNAIVLPGLVNVHTHLELHAFRDALAEDDFVLWLGHMRRIRERTPLETYRRGAKEGLLETWRHGTTTVGDVGASGATVGAVAELGGRGCYYHEVIGPEPERAGELMSQVESEVARLRETAPATLRVGVSPHAPYTVSPALAGMVASWCRDEGLPVATHLAEGDAEVMLLVRQQGPFADSWRRRGIPLPAASRSSVRWAETCGLLAADFMGIHLVRVNEDDLACLAAHDTAVAICVRSNRRHGHGDPPLGAMLDRGIRLGLGTDSAVSVGSLDLLAEARVVRGIADLSAEHALRLITIEAARALDMDQSVGSLEVGKWADCCIARLPGEASTAESVLDQLLQVHDGAIISTYLAGRLVYAA